jgi:hypothetical protein
MNSCLRRKAYKMRKPRKPPFAVWLCNQMARKTGKHVQTIFFLKNYLGGAKGFEGRMHLIVMKPGFPNCALPSPSLASHIFLCV